MIIWLSGAYGVSKTTVATEFVLAASAWAIRRIG
jgi:hypothetical protein